MHAARSAFVFAAALALPAFAAAQAPGDAEMERFLRTARVVSVKPVGTGVTKSLRATLTDGTITHDAHIQAVNGFKSQVRTGKQVERDFRDTWRYNVAAYKLDRMLGLHLVPVSVERTWRGQPAAFTWWVDDVVMDERERQTKGVVPPDHACWVAQMQILRMFDQLIENTDRNPGNTLISTGWRVWAIDHTRAFRRSPRPQDVRSLIMLDDETLGRLAALELDTLKNALGRYVGSAELRALLSRRDAIVGHVRSLDDAGRLATRCSSSG